MEGMIPSALPIAVALLQAGAEPQLPFPQPWVTPGFNRLLWVQSPHYNERPPQYFADVDTVVVHATVSTTLEGTTKWFVMPESKVSAHFTIDKDGSVIQHVSTFDRAWHAGTSRDAQGRQGVNDFSIGIELVNMNDGIDPYTPEQVEVLGNIIAVMKRRFPIKQIVSHEFIAIPPGRKSDPKNFPWEKLEYLGLPMYKDLPRSSQ
jgi:N-acetylmuramoyl-L-alanine amidase